MARFWPKTLAREPGAMPCRCRGGGLDAARGDHRVIAGHPVGQDVVEAGALNDAGAAAFQLERIASQRKVAGVRSGTGMGWQACAAANCDLGERSA